MPPDSYSSLPYETGTFVLPSPLAIVGGAYALFGIEPRRERLRCFDIGCGIGTSTIQLARSHPEMEFTGVDLSEKQIEIARQKAGERGVNNIQFHAGDFLEAEEASGSYDVVYCYGVFSWCPREIRLPMLQKIRALLSENGIAFVSYNVFPGWHLKGLLRDILLQGVDRSKPPLEQVQSAKAFFRYFMNGVPAHAPVRVLLTQQYEGILGYDDSYLFHEYLEENNEPFHFSEFHGLCTAAGLRFLTEYPFHRSRPPSGGDGNYFTPYLERSHSVSPTAFERAMDLVQWRQFRRSLVVRSEIEPKKADPTRIKTCEFRLGQIELPGNLTLDAIQPGMAFEGVAPYGGRVVLSSLYEIGILAAIKQVQPYADLCRSIQSMPAMQKVESRFEEDTLLRTLDRLIAYGFAIAYPCEFV